MTIAAGFTTRTPLNEAVMDIRISFGTMTPKLVVCFASPRYDLAEMITTMKSDIGTDGIIGCTSAGEITSGRMQKDGIAGIAFDEEVVDDLCIRAINGSAPGKDGLEKALNECAAHLGTTAGDMGATEYFGILTGTGSQEALKKTADALAELTSIPVFIAAGAENGEAAPSVFAGGEVLTDAAALAVVKPKARFKLCTLPAFGSDGGLLLEETKKILDGAEEEIGTKGGILAFHSFLPQPVDEDDDPVQAYTDLFMDTPAAGFTAFGEANGTDAQGSMLIMEKPKRKTFLDDL